MFVCRNSPIFISFSWWWQAECQCCVLSHLWCRSSLIWWQVTQQLSGITPRASRERGELKKDSCLSLWILKNKNINSIFSIERGGAMNLLLSMFYWEEATRNLHDHVVKPCVTWYYYHLPSSKSSMKLSKQHSDTHHSFLMWNRSSLHNNSNKSKNDFYQCYKQ